MAQGYALKADSRYRLSQRSAESVHLAVLQGAGVVIIDKVGAVVASLSLTRPTVRFTEEAIRTSFPPALREAAAAISADLGRPA